MFKSVLFDSNFFSNLFLVRLNLISSCKIARQQIMLKYQFICVFDFSLILFGVKKRVFLLVYKWNYWMFILAMGFGLVQFLDKNIQGLVELMVVLKIDKHCLYFYEHIKWCWFFFLEKPYYIEFVRAFYKLYCLY